MEPNKHLLTSIDQVPSKRAADFMVRQTHTIDSNASLIDAHNQMQAFRIHHLLVVDKAGLLLGILSDRDVKKFSSPFAGSPIESDRDRATMKITVSRFASKDVFTCRPNDPLKKCIEIMLQKSVHAIPVVDESNRLLGIVTATDMLKLLLNFC